MRGDMAAVPFAVLAEEFSPSCPAGWPGWGSSSKRWVQQAGLLPEACSCMAVLGLSSPLPAGFLAVGTVWALDAGARRGARSPSAAARSPAPAGSKPGCSAGPNRWDAVWHGDTRCSGTAPGCCLPLTPACG